MERKFTAAFERNDPWWIGWCLEVRGAYGQGETLDEARESLREAIKLVLEHDPIRRDAGPIGQVAVEERLLIELG